MDRKKKNGFGRLFAGLAVGVLFAGLMLGNVFYAQDAMFSDLICQRPVPKDGEIVLINIDQASLDALGPFGDWGRALMGDVLAILNENPQTAPAVVALDVLYVGESDDPEGDAYLAEMAGSGCPVVTACAGTYDAALVTEDDGSFYMADTLVAFDEPYDALRENSYQGHINSMFDRDGILRHGIWEIELPDGTAVPSFHRQIYELYCEAHGIPAETVPPCDDRNCYYVPFQGAPGDYSDGYGVIDLLKGRIDPSAYAGKIVLIGPYAAGMQDDFTTAADHAAKMYGVEYQANMLDALIHGRTMQEIPGMWQALFVLAASILLGMFFYRRKMLPATLVLAGTAVCYIAACFAAAAAGFVLSPFYLTAAVLVLYVVSVAGNYMRETLEKRRVTATFERYVAPEIVSELLKEGSDASALGGQLCDIAVLFVDIRGFTAMSELMKPEEIVEILNRYLTLTSECIFRNAGTLDKFIGDCTMAFWGAPLPQEDSVYKALKTAFEMREGAMALREELREKYGCTPDFGIGVHYGPAVVGNIGAKNRMDYTAVGDTVNTASRLESNAPGGMIYVSRAVADALEGRAEFTSLGDSIPLKGKAAGFEVLRAERLL